MAEDKNDIPKDVGSNLQKAAQAIERAAKNLENNFSKATDFAKSMNSEIKDSANSTRSVNDLLGKVMGLNIDLNEVAKDRAKEQNIQNLAAMSGQSIAMATLRFNKASALAQARKLGATQDELKAIHTEYDLAQQLTSEYEKQATEREAAIDLANDIEKSEANIKNKLKEITGYQGVFKDIFRDGELAAGIFGHQVLKGLKTSNKSYLKKYYNTTKIEKQF